MQIQRILETNLQFSNAEASLDGKPFTGLAFVSMADSVTRVDSFSQGMRVSSVSAPPNEYGFNYLPGIRVSSDDFDAGDGEVLIPGGKPYTGVAYEFCPKTGVCLSAGNYRVGIPDDQILWDEDGEGVLVSVGDDQSGRSIYLKKAEHGITSEVRVTLNNVTMAYELDNAGCLASLRLSKGYDQAIEDFKRSVGLESVVEPSWLESQKIGRHLHLEGEGINPGLCQIIAHRCNNQALATLTLQNIGLNAETLPDFLSQMSSGSVILRSMEDTLTDALINRLRQENPTTHISYEPGFKKFL